MRKIYHTYRPPTISSLLVLLALVISFTGFSQNATPSDTTNTQDTTKARVLLPNQVNVFFSSDNIELKKGEIISNVLEVINNTTEEQYFIIDILQPGGWMNLTDEKPIKLQPNEKKFVPVILVPSRLMNSNTEIIINVFLINEEDEQIAAEYFTLFTKKQISWEANVNNGQRLYFRNGETTKDFEYTVLNTGNFDQDIMISHKTNSGFMILKDTNDNILKDQAFGIKLNSMQDTTMVFRASVLDYKNRNFKKVSVLNHNPTANLEYRKYSVYLNSTEPKGLGKDVYKKSNKVDIIKLPNSKKVNPYGFPNLPLTVEAIATNVLSDYTFLSINLRGYKQLNAEASLAYFAQINYSKSYWGTENLKGVPWYIGYFDRKTTVEIGQVNGNLIGLYNFGQGIKASHAYFKRHKTSAFYVRDPKMFKAPRTESFGVGHEFKITDYFKITGKVGRGINHANNTTIDVASLNPSFGIANKHFFNLFGSVSNRKTNIQGVPPTSIVGYLVGGNYSTRYFKKVVKTNIGARYNDPFFSYGAFERLTANHRTAITVNPKFEIYVNNIFQDMKSYNTSGNNIGYTQKLLYNNMVFSTPTKFGSLQPGIFYDMTDFLLNRIHSRGLSLRVSNFNFHTNFMSSFFIKAGYSDPVDMPEISDYFALEMAALIRYRVWNFSANYTYGARSSNALINMQREGVTPQALRVSIQNQYQFKNQHFIMENVLTYNYNNRFNGHNIGVYPQFFYYTNSGWRFGLQGNYNYSSSNYSSIYDSYNVNNPINGNRGSTSNSNFNVSVSIKKDFGIPIPFVKNKHATNKIIAFYDVNGNNIREKDEPIMENVILRFGNNEVITNKDGEAEMANVPIGMYPFSVIALDKMEGWFANVEDSVAVMNSGIIYVPYVRGVKVYGDVTLDRQKIAITDKDKIFDMSRIKITAVGGKTYSTLTDIDGHFEFYLPNGEYTLTMDESILGDTYKLSRNNIPLTLTTTQDGVYMSFYIVEKRRKVKFKSFD